MPHMATNVLTINFLLTLPIFRFVVFSICVIVAIFYAQCVVLLM